MLSGTYWSYNNNKIIILIAIIKQVNIKSNEKVIGCQKYPIEINYQSLYKSVIGEKKILRFSRKQIGNLLCPLLILLNYLRL